MSERTAASKKKPIKNYHVTAVKIAAGSHSETVRCTTCLEAFSIRGATGIIARWPDKTYVAKLKSMLSQDHANKRQHPALFDLGA